MGLFRKNKEEQKSEVTWADIEKSMYAPGIPEELPEWFEKSSVDPTKLLHLTDGAIINANSWFNVETAAIFAGTRIPEPCDLCESEDSCKSCGKGPNNYLKAMTANQDCDVLLWELFSDRTNYALGIPDGGFIFFDQAVYPTFNTERGFKFESQKLAPVVLGELDVKDMGDETGMLNFADANASVDGNYFFANLRVPAGSYKVVAWMGYTNIGEIAPQAMGIYGAGFNQMLESDLATAVKLTPEIKSLVEGRDDGTVLARMGNNQDYLAQQNEELFENDFPTAISWKIQLQLEEDGENAIQELKAKEFGCRELLDIASLLMLRGKRALANSVFDLLLEDPELDEYEGMREFALMRRKTAPGSLPPMDGKLSAYRLNYEATAVVENEGYAKARPILIKVAELGLANALGALTWHELRLGNITKGIEHYERLSKFTHQIINSETVNCDSNYALLKLASGAPVQEAIDIWVKNVDSGHVETIFFSAMAVEQCGNDEIAREMLESLSADQWAGLEQQMKEEQRLSTGWFKDWCAEGSRFIKKYKP